MNFEPKPTMLNAASVPELHGYRLGYRADIEGLRAVAVMLVVAAHAGLPWLQGGFIGVDVFFVLSGYLITGLLVQEIDRTGRIALLDFYARRLRRLLPALLLMLCGSSLLAILLLGPSEQPGQAKAAVAASLWLSNLHFNSVQLDYFGTGAESSLFLHTWSLGVEEQFYLAWPLWVLFLLGSWSWQGGHRNWQRLRGGMLATMLLCLALSIFLTYVQPTQGFYLMPSRAWQFALGAITLLTFSRTAGSAQSLTAPGSDFLARRVAGWLGLLLVLGSGLFLDRHHAYPGGWALLPSIGTALILAAGTQTTAALGVSRLLSLPPLQRLGELSYSWYLWHWPALLLGATVAIAGRPAHPMTWVILSLALAYLSHRWVESPLRHSRLIAARPLTTVLGSALLMGGTVLLGNLWQSKAVDWMGAPSQQPYVAVRSDLPALYAVPDCDEWYRSAQVRVCAFGNAQGKQTVLLLGDSVTVQWFPAVMRTYAEQGWRVLVLTKSACPMVDEGYFYPRIGRHYIECEQWRAAALAAANSLRPEVIVTGSTTTYPFTEAQWREGSRRTLGALSAAAEQVFVLRATPALPFDGPDCLARHAWRSPLLPAPPACSAPASNSHDDAIFAWVSQATGAYPNVRMLDLNALICPAQLCEAAREGRIVFRDTRHITASYIDSVGDAFAQRINEAESHTAAAH